MKLLLFVLASLLTMTAEAAPTYVATPGQSCLYTGAGTGKPIICQPTYQKCVDSIPLTKKATYMCKTPFTVDVPPPVVVPPAPMVTAWVRAANSDYTRDPISAPIGAKVRIGDGFKWAEAVMVNGMQCALGWFNSDGAGMAYTKYCETQRTVPAVVQVPGEMPTVNKALTPPPANHATGPQIMELTAEQIASGQFTPVPPPPNSDWPNTGDAIGAFRVAVPYSHMSNDDPIVYPNNVGAAHFHTYAGNGCTNANTTSSDSLFACNQSTSGGGTLNKTAYWFPTMIDIRTGQPIAPYSANFYYKGGYQGVDPTKIQPFPKGLKMIAGDAGETKQFNGYEPQHVGYRCVGGPNNQNFGNGREIPSCDVGAQMWQDVDFPQCWDGVNLDSPDHKSHMAYGIGTKNADGSPKPNVNGCPLSHPIALTAVSLNTIYLVTEANAATFWKLSSDHYVGTGGHSLHADWFGAWDEETEAKWLANCVNARADCHNHLLGKNPKTGKFEMLY